MKKVYRVNYASKDYYVNAHSDSDAFFQVLAMQKTGLDSDEIDKATVTEV